MVRMLAFYSNDPSSNPAEAYSFIAVKFVFKKNENKLKETVVGPFLKKETSQSLDVPQRYTKLDCFYNKPRQRFKGIKKKTLPRVFRKSNKV